MSDRVRIVFRTIDQYNECASVNKLLRTSKKIMAGLKGWVMEAWVDE